MRSPLAYAMISLSAFVAIAGNTAADKQQKSLEIAVMLDVSGSMTTKTSNGKTRMDDLKDASKDFVNIIFSIRNHTARLAVIPFSADVRPTSEMLPQVVPPITNTAWPKYRSFTKRGDHNDNDQEEEEATFNYYRTACVGERQGSNKHTDAAASPTSEFVTQTYVYSSVLPASYNAAKASSLCSTPVSGTVLPLTSDKATLLSMIGGLTTGGGAAGHVGTAWAYYMLSPEWALIVPDGSEPVAYGTSNVKKIAILMSDGEYNFSYDNDGISANDGNASPSANGYSSSVQAIATCNQMKQDGIEVYTVGFDLGDNSNAIETLNDCATDLSKSYIAETGKQLKQAFRDIALKVVSNSE